MKKTIALLGVFLLLISGVVYADEYGDQFFEAEELIRNEYVYGEFPTEYDTDTFQFTAPVKGYYSIRGKADKQVRGHLYDERYNFLYGGSKLSSGDAFFIAAYLDKGEKVYIKVDSLVREEQDYSLIVFKDYPPFNRIVFEQSKIVSYSEPNSVETVKIPVHFYQNSKKIHNVEYTYPFMMKIKSEGLLRGQAAFNLNTNELEIDLYDENDAMITLSIGDEIESSCSIKSIHIVEEEDSDDSSDDQDQLPNDEDEEPIEEDDYYRDPEVLQGDVDLNNRVDMNDVVSILDRLTVSKFTQEQFALADTTGNSVVDASDALLILRRISGANR